jgi:hypothetical protein
MVNLRKHSSKIFFLAALVCFLFIAAGCSKKEKSASIVAKVNDAVLTEDDLNIALSQDRNKGKFREEYVQNWIEKEVLFQQASKKGIQDESQFKFMADLNKKELAVALFISKIMDENNVDISDNDIRNYYENNKEDFRLNDNVFVMNEIYFNDFDKAVQFRNDVLNNDWNRALNIFNGDKSIVEVSPQNLYYQYQIQPITLLRVVNNMEVGETSIVLETEPSKYALVQLITKYDNNSIPPFEVIKDKIKDRLLIIKKKDFLKNYIDKLIAEHNTEVVRYSE